MSTSDITIGRYKINVEIISNFFIKFFHWYVTILGYESSQRLYWYETTIMIFMRISWSSYFPLFTVNIKTVSCCVEIILKPLVGRLQYINRRDDSACLHEILVMYDVIFPPIFRVVIFPQFVFLKMNKKRQHSLFNESYTKVRRQTVWSGCGVAQREGNRKRTRKKNENNFATDGISIEQTSINFNIIA